jgi:hypothetical protein
MKRAAREGRRVKITHYGKTLVGVIPAKDLHLLQECEEKLGKPAPSRRKRTAAR